MSVQATAVQFADGRIDDGSVHEAPHVYLGDDALTVLGKWLQWDSVDSATVALTDETVLADSGSKYSGPSVTGRLTLDKDGPLNVVVVAFVKTSAGTVVSSVVMDCVQTGQQRAFETKNFDDAHGPYELEKIVAFPTSVKGAGPQYDPSC